MFLSESVLLGAFGDDSVYVWSLETLQVTHEVLQLSRHRAGLADVAAARSVLGYGKGMQILVSYYCGYGVLKYQYVYGIWS